MTDSNIINPYELQIRKALDNLLPNAYKNIKNIENFPIEIGKNILFILMKYACQSQNLSVIMLGRNKIKEIPLVWLTVYFFEVSDATIDFEDDWEYLRLLELVQEVIPEFLSVFINKGLISDNVEIQEAAKDFL